MTTSRHIYQRPVGVVAILVAVLALGAIGLPSLRLDLVPTGISFPMVRVSMSMDTESSAEALEAITRPAEEIVRALPGVHSVQSETKGGSIDLRIEAAPGLGIEVLAGRIGEAFDTNLARFPGLTRRPSIRTYSSADWPIVAVAFATGDRDPLLMRDLVERRLAPAALRVPGVTRVDHSLEGQGTVLIAFDQQRTAAARANPGRIAQHLAAAHPRGFTIPTVDGGVRRETVVQLAPEDLTPLTIPRLRLEGGGELGEIAAVLNEPPAHDRHVMVDGQPGVLLQVYCSPDANGYRTSAEAVAALTAAAAAAGTPMLVQHSTHRHIDAALAELADSALWGAFFACAFLFLFLRRVRLALLVCLTLPLSLALAVLVLAATGQGVNIPVMIGFLLAVGMVVDNAIVVAEALMRSPDSDDPEERVRGHRRAVAAVATAITVSTLVMLAIFTPLMVLNRNPWFKAMITAMGQPIAYSLLGSLAIALVVVPIFFARLYPARPGVARTVDARRGHGRARWLEACERGYGRLIACVLLRPWLGATLFTVLVVGPGVGMGWLMATGSIPLTMGEGDNDNRMIYLSAKVRGERTLQEVVEAFSGWERELAPHRQRLGITSTVANISDDWGTYQVYLVPIDPLGRTATAIEEELTGLLSAGLNVVLSNQLTRFQSMALPVESEPPPTASGAAAKGGKAKDAAPGAKDPATDAAKEGEGKVAAKEGEGKVAAKGGDRKKPVAKVQSRRQRGAVSFTAPSSSPNRIGLKITAPSYELLDQAWTALRAQLAATPGVEDPGPVVGDAEHDLELVLSRDAEAQGWRADQLAGQVMRFAATRQVTTMPDGWVLRTGPLERAPRTMERLLGLEMTRGDGSVHELRALVTDSTIPTTDKIERRDGMCQQERWIGVEPARKQRIIAELPAIVERAGLPGGCGASLSWRDARGLEDARQLNLAFWLSLIIIYLLMGILYESIIAPLSVMVMVAATMISVLAWLWLSGVQMDTMTLLGAIFLIGIVANHGIVLIDRLVQIAPLPRCDGSRRVALAIAAGSRRRFAPVLITSLTTIAGALPMAWGSGRIAGIGISSLGTCIAIGLSAATLCTLLLVPNVYQFLGWSRRMLVKGTRWC